MYIESRGRYTSLNDFYKIVTLSDISVDNFSIRAGIAERTERQKHLDWMLNSVDEKELIIIEGAADGIRKSRERSEA